MAPAINVQKTAGFTVFHVDGAVLHFDVVVCMSMALF
jgi:hypothetical protein